MSYALTPNQKRCLDFIRRRIDAEGIAPTVREIMDEIGQNSSGETHRLLKVLEQRGHIRRLPGKARAIEIVPQTKMTDAAIDEMDRFAMDHVAGRIGGRNDYMTAFERIVRAGARA